MTREEAIDFGEMWLEVNKDSENSNTYEFVDISVKILKQEPSGDMVSRGVYEQVKWERDIAIKQLKELGYELGQKVEPSDDTISRQSVIDITWEEPSYTDALNVLTEVRDKVKALPTVNPQKNIVNNGTMNITL